MLLKRQRVTQQASLQVAPPPPQPVFLVEDDLEEERRAKVQRTDDDFSPLLSGLEDGTPEPGYVPPMLSYTSLVKRALCPAGSPRDKSLTKDSPQDKTSPEPVQATSASTKSEGEVKQSVAQQSSPAKSAPAQSTPVQSVQPAQPAQPAVQPMRFGKGTGRMSELLCLVNPATSDASRADGPTWRAKTRASLLSLDLHDFKSFKRRQFQLEGRSLSCVVGCNSSGKSAVLDALRFALGRQCDRNLRDYIRRGKPMTSNARVSVQFRYEQEAEEGSLQGTVLLVREVRVHPDRSNKDSYILSHWVQEEGQELKEVSQEGYDEWLKALQWMGGDLLLPQFGLIDGRSASGLLAMLPEEIEKVGSEGTASGSLLKRRCTTKGAARAFSSASSRSRTEAAEAWLTRRIDEVYRELTREPLDDTMEEWGEGGEAKLRRLPDGSFDLLTSAKRGGASSGYGTSLNSLSDGARDVCALSMLFVLPGFISGMQDASLPFIVLDEPDSRLDKRHASALRRYLQKPDGPKQCLWLSLNNHQAFQGDIMLDETEDLGDSVLEDLEIHQAQAKARNRPGAGGRTALNARFLCHMSARLREETEAELDEDQPETL
ncbi:unnamed protein product [Cladocopium goreaui]|uniref:S-adenosylmethionine synthase n=1 Tax=Cladocopium goreaui TaxID=2562237 RepID=A0A9P1CLN8_9DINO|nr:unnamed protein product [Cladocopium goreaui]